MMLGDVPADGLKKRDMRYRLKDDPRNGLLHVKAPLDMPGYWRYWPSADLQAFVEHYWTIEWNLREPQRVETLPYPSAHVVFEPGVAQLAGVTTKKFTRELEGTSRVLGVKFWPGALRPFVRRRVTDFTDKVLPLTQVFGAAAAMLDARVLAHADHHAAIGVVEAFLRALKPTLDDGSAAAIRVSKRIAEDRDVQTVEQVARFSGMGMRSLQRLFDEHVGVGPKWMIRRYRLQEAATRMAGSDAVDWPRIALELGYADQAHFIRDFKRLIGQSPAEYFRAMSASVSR